jgi:arginine/ornithine transport system permease protein
VFYGAAALLYLAITSVSELGFKTLNDRLQIGVRAQRL